jgi:hypothetical protein
MINEMMSAKVSIKKLGGNEKIQTIELSGFYLFKI